MSGEATATAARAGGGSDQTLDPGGNYEIIRARLIEQSKELGVRIDALNDRRKALFGGTELAVLANERIRTENNCIPRDIINVGGKLLVGYNVFIGMKKETSIEDVFSVHTIGEGAQDGQGLDLTALEKGTEAGYLVTADFEKEFADLFKYFKDARLLSLRATETRVLAVFQTGATIDDLKVMRWRINPDGRIEFMDGRGQDEYTFPNPFDFEWANVTRKDQISGRYPHLSILDQVFLETTGGDLTIKVENNTESGRGVYSEPVDDANQALDDAEVLYAKVGNLILLKILPFREEKWRYLVFNPRNESVTKIDALAQACQSLPEDQGILFPGGFLLETGEHKSFDDDFTGLLLEKVIRSPNGEDILYVFHRREEGLYQLLPYNVIRQELQTPIRCHGFSIFEDGRMIVFRAQEEASRVHPIQIWQTPFTSAQFAAEAPTDGSFLAKVGNAELVRGVRDCFTVRRLIQAAEPGRQTYEDIIRTVTRTLDAYYWLESEEVALKPALTELGATAELIVDEFEKVLAMKKRAAEELGKAQDQQEELVSGLREEELTSVDGFMKALTALRHQRGHLISLKDTRYIDVGALDGLEADVIGHFDRISTLCTDFLLGDDALVPITGELDRILDGIDECKTVAQIQPLVERLDETGEGLDVISEIVQGLEVEDATARTRILEGISEVFSHINRVRATVMAHRKELLGQEGRAEFAAQFKLLGQSVGSGLALADSPEKCDEQLSRLMIQLEELEARFGELDEFLGDIAQKREEIYDAFSAKKQSLVDARQRRAGNLLSSAERILGGVARRAKGFDDQDDLNAYFASDPMIMKLRQIADQLRELGDAVKADDVDARLKASRQDALRGMRDKADLYEEGDLIKLGKHRFSYNTQPLELSMVPRGEGMALHLTGTEFYEEVIDEEFVATRDFWPQQFVSETTDVYRGEYLAACILFDAENGDNGLTIAGLHDRERDEEGLLGVVREVAGARYDEGYDRGVHDADAALLLEKLLSLRDSAGLLRFPATPRGIACLYWARLDDAATKENLHRRAMSLGRLRASFGPVAELTDLTDELAENITEFAERQGIAHSEGEARLAGRYLAEELMADHPRFTTSAEAQKLKEALFRELDVAGTRRAFDEDLRALADAPRAQVAVAIAWLRSFVEKSDNEDLAALSHAAVEAGTLMLTEGLERDVSQALTHVEVTGLLGQHSRIAGRKMDLRLDEYLDRLSDFVHRRVPGFHAYREKRHALLERERQRLRLDEYKPRVMTSFVRNKLINDVYLPMIGDNLAKQLGAAGDDKRTDLMGLLLLISPPGYGKTTLMEYIANRLGMVFMKINGPSLGHGVVSLDPSEAPNATARQEVEKINLAFEMASNVMLYLDDIQHTHPELLQKFISLCDGQRRIEGVYQGRTRTYDMRGKKFCVVMAGNPYTESGDKFQIPDMLANRADTYNLGDVLSGKDDVFALSYIENSLTSNPVLAPLASRDQDDFYKIVRMAQGEEVPTTDLSYGYAAAEIQEMTSVFQKLFKARDVLLMVNAQYIESASQEESYRTEPAFKLQGSYRNMNKLSEKIVSAMNDVEVEALIDDHYMGESQTLTTGAEQNLLKLAEMRGRMSDEQQARWVNIKREFGRLKSQGGGDDDPVTRLTGTLGGLGRELEGIRDTLLTAADRAAEHADARAAADAQARQADRARQAAEAQRGEEAARAAAARATAAEAGSASGSALMAAIGPQLTTLQAALERLANPKVEVTVEAPAVTVAAPAGGPGFGGAAVAPAPGVHEATLARQVEIMRTTLLPLVASTNQNLDDAKELHDHIIQLLDLVRRMDSKLRERYDV